MIEMSFIFGAFAVSTVVVFLLDKTPGGFVNYYVNPAYIFVRLLIGFAAGEIIKMIGGAKAPVVE